MKEGRGEEIIELTSHLSLCAGDMPDTSVGPEMTREKDRLQYKHQFFQIDLTQVKATKVSDIEWSLGRLKAGFA